MQKSVIIVAGGSGSRVGGSVLKQFMELAGMPVLMHTLNAFRAFDPDIEIVVVLPEGEESCWRSLCRRYSFNVAHSVAPGGRVRFYSVKNGIDLVTSSDLIAVHDGVRPLVDRETIGLCFEAAYSEGASLPVLPLTESLRKGTLEKSESVDRSDYYVVQTPQVFRRELLVDAYNQPWQPKFTDDASVVESLGHPIRLVPGSRRNIKITHKDDFSVAEFYLKSGSGCTGQG